MAQGFKALPPLGPYFGSDWFLDRPGDGAFDPMVNRTQAEAAEARKLPLPPNLESYAAALTRDELDENVVKEWAPFIVPDIERGEWITAMLKNCKTAKHTAIALMLYPPMERHCPRCTQIHDPRHRRFSEGECKVLGEEGPPEGFKACSYIYCAQLPTHARRYCPKINLRCFHCLYRGHGEKDGVCADKDVNLALFEDVTQFGWVTENRYRPEGCAAGFYPVITIPQVRYVESMGGYATLMALSVEDARAMRDEGIQLHIKWVGA
jgi:hypothetical protein